VRNTQTPYEKLKREVLDRIVIFKQASSGKLNDFLSDMADVINLDGLPRHYLQVLNKIDWLSA